MTLRKWTVSTFCRWNIPITFDSSAWYAIFGYIALFVVIAIALYGFRIALGGRPLFDLSRVEGA